MIVSLITSGFMLLAAPTATALPLDDIIRCVALDDAYWDGIVSSGAGERSQADMDWRERNLNKAVAEGARQKMTETQVFARYSEIFNPLQMAGLDDAQRAEQKQCRKKLS